MIQNFLTICDTHDIINYKDNSEFYVKIGKNNISIETYAEVNYSIFDW